MYSSTSVSNLSPPITSITQLANWLIASSMKRDDYKETLGNEGKEKVIGEAVLYDSLWDVSDKVDSIEVYEKSIGGAIVLRSILGV